MDFAFVGVAGAVLLVGHDVRGPTPDQEAVKPHLAGAIRCGLSAAQDVEESVA
jgi:hypothetical protein